MTHLRLVAIVEMEFSAPRPMDERVRQLRTLCFVEGCEDRYDDLGLFAEGDPQDFTHAFHALRNLDPESAVHKS